MRVNKDELNRLKELSDEELWAEIVRLGGRYGVKMPTATPPHDQLEKLRATFSGVKLNIPGALKILDEYRQGGK